MNYCMWCQEFFRTDLEQDFHDVEVHEFTRMTRTNEQVTLRGSG